MYTCIIIDDEPAAHYVLVNYIERMSNFKLVQQSYNAIEALNYLRDNKVDLIFLDIDMPEINGLDFLKMLSHPPFTILTTAYSSYALESYEYGVIDYLLKPIGFPRFLKSVERFFSFNLDDKNTVETASINLKVDGRFVNICLQKIDYFQSFGNYVKVVTKSKTYLTASTTQQLLLQIPPSKFMRIHKSYIVALAKISEFHQSTVLLDQLVLPVGITFRRALQDRLIELERRKI